MKKSLIIFGKKRVNAYDESFVLGSSWIVPLSLSAQVENFRKKFEKTDEKTTK